MAIEKQFCTFYLDNYCFGVSVLEVQEVFRYQEITSIPLAPKVVTGMINLRGQILTAVNLRLRLGMEPRPEDQVPMNIVTRTNGTVMNLLVDRIGDVMEIPEDLFELPPDTVQRSMRELVIGVYKLKNRLLMVLDTKKIAQFDAVAA